MPLVTSKDLLERAAREGYAVGAFNANNMEMVQAIVETAEEEKAPVIVQISQGAINYAGADYFAALVKIAAQKALVPVVLHLDHGMDLRINVQCLRAGFSSLMFDGSRLPFAENVAITRQVVELAHMVGVPVEGEIGKVPTTGGEAVPYEELRQFFTKPEEAVEFFQASGVDSLAVSVGSAHKMKVQEAILDIERIAAIREAVQIPLVLHGASGVKDDQIPAAVKAGIAKINVATELGKVYTAEIKRAFAADPDEVDLRKYTAPARAAVKEVVREKIRLFGSQGKAPAVFVDGGAWSRPDVVREAPE
ncbi:MAG: class II fructose-bisphosphate aldolase family protein [Firmicutes bacterium]|nr:class II fructose-bisphosphate aldolase family protein [Bacillota bacterium]